MHGWIVDIEQTANAANNRPWLRTATTTG